MAGLIRFAIEETFEDDLDVLRIERYRAEDMVDPQPSIPLGDVMREFGITTEPR
jgi:hypothetical protein